MGKTIILMAQPLEVAAWMTEKRREDNINWRRSRLSCVMVSVLATAPNVRGLNPGRGDGFLRAIKILSTLSFGG
jgi:hypothetical protein